MTLHFPDEVETNILDRSTPPTRSPARPSSRRRAIRVEPLARRRARGRPPTPPIRQTHVAAAPLMDIVLHKDEPSGGGARRRRRGPRPARQPWVGAPARTSDRDARVARGGHAARAQRHLLLPMLHAVQARAGWISRGRAQLHLPAARRSRRPRPTAWPRSTRCSRSSRSRRPWRTSAPTSPAWRARREGAVRRARARRRAGGAAARAGQRPGPIWLESPCLGMCERAPAAMVTVAGEEPRERLGRADADGRRHRGAARRRRRARAEPPPTVPQAGDPRGCGCCAASAWSTRRASTATARTAATRPCAPRSSMGRAGRAARGQRRQAARPRRGRVPDRPQVGGRRGAPEPPALPHLQRRRVRARDVQGPRDPRAATRSASSRR